MSVGGETLNIWRGTATAESSTEHYSISTDLAFDLDGTPRFVNVSHPLWVQTAARIDGFVREAPDSVFEVPHECFKEMEAIKQMGAIKEIAAIKEMDAIRV